MRPDDRIWHQRQEHCADAQTWKNHGEQNPQIGVWNNSTTESTFGEQRPFCSLDSPVITPRLLSRYVLKMSKLTPQNTENWEKHDSFHNAKALRRTPMMIPQANNHFVRNAAPGRRNVTSILRREPAFCLPHQRVSHWVFQITMWNNHDKVRGTTSKSSIPTKDSISMLVRRCSNPSSLPATTTHPPPTTNQPNPVKGPIARGRRKSSGYVRGNSSGFCYVFGFVCHPSIKCHKWVLSGRALWWIAPFSDWPI